MLTFHASSFSSAENKDDAKNFIIDKLEDLEDYVSTELPADTDIFNVTTQQAAQGQKRALLNKIKAVINQISHGWPQVREGSINKLENDLINTIKKWIKSEYYRDILLGKIQIILNLLRGVPVAAFNFTPKTPKVGETVTFNASESYDLNGYIVDYLWDFGDGNNGSGMITTHVYLTEGTYIVTLTVIDNEGFSDTAQAEVTVSPKQIHDIAILSVIPSSTSVEQGQSVTIWVVIENQGDFAESFTVTAYYDDIEIETKAVTELEAGVSITLTFTWDTTGVSEGVYTISATATVVEGEEETDDNTYIDGTVTVVPPPAPPAPPVASFIFSPTTPYTGQNVTFDASSSYDPDGTIVSYIWSFGDGTTGYGEVVTHIYVDDGTYVVELTVVDNDTLTDTESKEVTVLNRPPVASFTESAKTAYTDTTIYFNASASYDPDGKIIDYFWDFGDGTTGTGVFVSHSYPDDGTYTVTLTVTDDDGETATATATKTILNRIPTASFTESAETVYTGETIYFNASNSYDPDGTIVSYFWDFGDGTTGTGVTVEHAYADDGLYIVKLTVTDDDGATATTTAAKAVANRPPIASFTENATIAYRGEVIRFNATESFDPDGYIASYFWTFGDGTNATGVIVDHIYINDGNYTVTLTVTDDDGALAIVTATKYILNHPPIASFTENATTVKTGELIQFDASASYDPDGTIVSYTWNFGDGATASGITVTHAYADDGTYTVTLTVTDNDGATASLTATKTVLNRPPVASFTESALTVYAGEVIQFNASGSYDPDGTIVSYTWNFGDGNVTTTASPIINHTYTAPGTYNVTLTVTDDDGQTDDEIKTFTVQAAPWPLWLIIVIILLILAAIAVAIYLWRKRRKKKQGIASSHVENYKLTIFLCF
jgi:PKD repeat protein